MISAVPTNQSPILTKEWQKVKNSSNDGTGGLSGQILGALGLGVVGTAVGSLVADAVVDKAGDAVAGDSRAEGKVFLVTLKFDNGPTVRLPIYKDDTIVFTERARFFAATIPKENGQSLWLFPPKRPMPYAAPGDENYEKACVNGIDQEFVKNFLDENQKFFNKKSK